MTALTLFSQRAIVSNGTSNTAHQVLGMQFSASAAAPFNAIWFYSPASATQLPGAVALYTVSGQTAVAVNSSPSWSGAAGSGWVRCDMSSFAVTLTAGTAYVAAAWSSATGLWDNYQTGYWTTGGAGANGISNGILSAPNSAGGNTGLLLNSAGAITYPTGSFSNSNYWIDVEVTGSASGLLMAAGIV